MRQLYNRYLLCLYVAFLSLTGCDNWINPQHKASANETLTNKTHIFKTQEQVGTFLNLYAPTDTFPINISTKIGEWEGPESANFKWRGNVIPSSFWAVFNSLVPYHRLAEDPPFYANQWFRVNNTTLALITRVPGAYWSSQVYLFLFDTHTYKITKSLRVAEAWADMGDSFYLESRIDKLAENRFSIIINQGECHPVDENYEKFTCADTIKTYQIINQEFRFISARAAKK